MNRKSVREKRKYPRISHRLALNLAANGYDFATSTQNVSCVGAYCNINKYMPPFTKLMVMLSFPVIDDKKNEICKLQCKGVVVRTEDAVSGGYNIAIFFNQINENQRNKISQYVNQFLPQQSSSR